VSHYTKAIRGLTNGTFKTGHYTGDGHQHPPRHSLPTVCNDDGNDDNDDDPNIGSNTARLILRIQDVTSKNVYPY
jgi:hypothetical protein